MSPRESVIVLPQLSDSSAASSSASRSIRSASLKSSRPRSAASICFHNPASSAWRAAGEREWRDGRGGGRGGAPLAPPYHPPRGAGEAAQPRRPAIVLSGEDVGGDGAGHVGQAEVAAGVAVRQFLVVETHQGQQG